MFPHHCDQMSQRSHVSLISKTKGGSVSQWVSDKVTYWAVRWQLKTNKNWWKTGRWPTKRLSIKQYSNILKRFWTGPSRHFSDCISDYREGFLLLWACQIVVWICESILGDTWKETSLKVSHPRHNQGWIEFQNWAHLSVWRHINRRVKI